MHAHDPDTQPAGTFTEDVCAGLVRRAIGPAEVDLAVRTVSPWTMTAQVAARYREGRVFLVGDAAHRFPPSGGMGMNTGIQDVHNLAWKLRAVTEGWADAALLDTYERERRPIAERNAEQSFVNAMRILEMAADLGITEATPAARAAFHATLADPAGRERIARGIASQQDHFDMLGLQLGLGYESGALVPDGSAPPAPSNPVREYVPTTRPGARLPHAWVERAGRRCSTLDLVAGDCCTLVAAPGAAAWVDDATRRASIPMRCVVEGRDFADPEGHWRRVRGVGDEGALLVRPDQHIAWRAACVPASLAGAERAIAGR